MSERDLQRIEVLSKVVDGRTTIVSAARVLALSTRQVRRLLERIRTDGAAAIRHRARGRPSNNRICDGVRDYAVAIVRERYADFGPTLAAEKLAEEHGLTVSRETLRKWLSDAGVWLSRQQRRTFHQPRLRREAFGELVQIDGSEHRWFEDRGDPCTLLVFIDDATGKLQKLRFVKSESTFAYFEVLESRGRASDKRSSAGHRLSLPPPDGRPRLEFAKAISRQRARIRPIHERHEVSFECAFVLRHPVARAWKLVTCDRRLRGMRRICLYLQATQHTNIAHIGVSSQTWDNIYIAKPLRGLGFRCAPIHETRRTDNGCQPDRLLDTGPSLSLPPDENCLGTSPSQAAKSRPHLKLPIAGQRLRHRAYFRHRLEPSRNAVPRRIRDTAWPYS